MELIGVVTVGAGGAASMEFTNIPQDATDLFLLVSGRSTINGLSSGWFDAGVRLNGDSGNNYAWRDLGTTNLNPPTSQNQATDSRFALRQVINPNDSVDGMGGFSLTIPNYSNNFVKVISGQGAGTDRQTVGGNNVPGKVFTGGLWNNSTAVTSLTIFTAGNWQPNSTATLFKIVR